MVSASFRHCAVTRTWNSTGNKPVPVGVQTACPVFSNTGWPSTNTLVDPTVHWAVTQGPFPAGGTKAHPATV
jgi:hypothetical protein